MIITKKRINSISKYIRDFSSGDKVVLSIPNVLIHTKLVKFGIASIYDQYTVPNMISKLTVVNCDGKWNVLKHLDKEMRLIEKEYSIKDWTGNWHYGVCQFEKMCYRREFIEPLNIHFIRTSTGIHSIPLEIGTDDDEIKETINLLLDMNDSCVIQLEGKEHIFNDILVEKVNWAFLPKGVEFRDAIHEKIIEKNTGRKPDYLTTIMNRSDKVLDYKPDKIWIGLNTFHEYIAYGFESLGLVVLESNKLSNATYVFDLNWKDLSKITKGQLISGNLFEHRLIHDQNWEAKIHSILS